MNFGAFLQDSSQQGNKNLDYSSQGSTFSSDLLFLLIFKVKLSKLVKNTL